MVGDLLDPLRRDAPPAQDVGEKRADVVASRGPPKAISSTASKGRLTFRLSQRLPARFGIGIWHLALTAQR